MCRHIDYTVVVAVGVLMVATMDTPRAQICCVADVERIADRHDMEMFLIRALRDSVADRLTPRESMEIAKAVDKKMSELLKLDRQRASAKLKSSV